MLVELIAATLEKNEHRLRLYTAYLGGTAVIIGLLITTWATLTLRPLKRLGEAARRIAHGDYASRIEEKGPAEVADLAREFNVMGRAVEEREKQLVQSERLAVVGKMASVITHEVRNPLSSIGLNTELLEELMEGALEGAEAEEARSLCRSINQEVDRLTAITEEYLQYARLPKPKLASESLARIIENLVGFEREQLATRGVELKVSVEEGIPPVLVDEGQIRQCLLNLIRNAADAAEATGGGDVELRAERRDSSFVVVSVLDFGPGIPEDQLPRLFDFFYSTKERGTGVGLAFTHQIVKEHGGEIEVETAVGRGSTFRVSLPVAPEDGMGDGN